MKHRIRVYHVPTGKKWDSVPVDTEEKELTKIITDVAEAGAHFRFETDNASLVVFPKKILQESVFMLIEVDE